MKDEGNEIAIKSGGVDACKRYCNENSDCKSFAVCESTGSCYLKDKKLDGSEASEYYEDCQTYFPTCGRY